MTGPADAPGGARPVGPPDVSGGAQPAAPVTAQVAAGAVVVLVPAALRVDSGGAARLSLTAGSLATVLDQVRDRWPRLERRIRDERGELRRYVNVYVDGEDCRALGGLDTPVPAGAEVQVLPSIAGG